jgi:DNA-binding MarR family transcriptional regulator
MRESLMVQATQIEVHPELYAVYRQVGPKQWLECARLICEDQVSPREIIARLEMSPIDIEEAMRDLIRRGVVTLKKG